MEEHKVLLTAASGLACVSDPVLVGVDESRFIARKGTTGGLFLYVLFF
jgi:hypothetical protein